MIEHQLRADGKDAWLRTTKVPLFDENGDVIGILCTQEDVTDRVESEEALRKSEQKYRTLAEQSLQGLTIISDHGFVYVNSAFAEMVGRPVDDLMGLEPEQVWDIFHTEDREVLRRRAQAKVAGKPMPSAFECRVVLPDGSIRWLESYAQKIEFQGEDAIQTVWIDTTERWKAERAIRTEKDRANLYLDLMGHDIRQQLQVIMNSATLLRTATDEHVRSSFFGIIEDAVQRCSRLIEEVRATEYLMTLPLTRRSLLNALQNCVNALSVYSLNVQFHNELTVDDAEIMADGFLELLLTNVISNAIEHNRNPERHVWIVLEERNDAFVVSVADNGPGIGDKRKKELFDMTRRYGGVGLHQSNQIIEKYGGMISVSDRVEGKPEQGARFELWFPKNANGL